MGEGLELASFREFLNSALHIPRALVLHSPPDVAESDAIPASPHYYAHHSLCDPGHRRLGDGGQKSMSAGPPALGYLLGPPPMTWLDGWPLDSPSFPRPLEGSEENGDLQALSWQPSIVGAQPARCVHQEIIAERFLVGPPSTVNPWPKLRLQSLKRFATNWPRQSLI